MKEVKFRGKRIDNGECLCRIDLQTSYARRLDTTGIIIGMLVAFDHSDGYIPRK